VSAAITYYPYAYLHAQADAASYSAASTVIDRCRWDRSQSEPPLPTPEPRR
jgi:hypothetical protein